jgi:methylmalonyl-CoA/ethylmalonyl-CoA epimerase
MITGLEHIAIAVPDLAKAIRRFQDDFGFELNGVEAVAQAQTETAFFPVASTSIELVSPLEGQGPIAKYLEKKPGGLHHICFQSDDVVADMARLQAKGYEFLSEQPLEGAHNCKVVFIHPRSCDGVLVELSQPADDADAGSPKAHTHE